jgi:1-acyl-sn-glycerol-3-phosphate acyltransferase
MNHTPAAHLSMRLAIATGAEGFGDAGLFAWYGILAFGLYPLRQRSDQEASLRGLFRTASAGNAVLIFPQGVHANPDAERAGDPQVRFRTGAAHLAHDLEAVVVPFGLAGTEKLMPVVPETWEGSRIGGIPAQIRRGPLAIAYGPPLVLDPKETLETFTKRLQSACYVLTRQAEAALG